MLLFMFEDDVSRYAGCLIYVLTRLANVKSFEGFSHYLLII